MKQFFLWCVILIFAPIGVFAKVTQYDIDPSHTRIVFFISHNDFSNMVGQFHKFQGKMWINHDHPEDSRVHVVIEASSVDVAHKELNHKLQNEHFFNTGIFPTITFRSSQLKQMDDKRANLQGNLTMLGITQPISMEVTFNKVGEFFGKERIGFSATGSLKRSDFGMDYIQDVVGDRVEFIIEVEGTKRLDPKQP